MKTKNVTIADIATFHAFLWEELQTTFDLEQSWYETASGGGGRVDASLELAQISTWAESKLTALTIKLQGLPGVFYYEQVCNFAEFLVFYVRDEKKLPDQGEVEAEIEKIVNKWCELTEKHYE